MSKDAADNGDDDRQDENEAELARVSGRLQDIDLEFVPKSEMSPYQGTPELPRFRPLTQAGLDEMVGISLRRLSSVDDAVKDRICSSILVTGGCTLFPVLDSRLDAGIRRLRHFLSPLKVVRASDSILDAWRGAAMYAMQFPSRTFSIQDYYQKGENALCEYRIKYSL